MKKYLILGGNGFIGEHIVEKLSLDNEVVIADRTKVERNNNNVSFKQIDFINCNDFSEYLKDVDTVIHLISTIGPNENISNSRVELVENVFPTLQLLEDMVKTGTKKIIFISSGGTIYGEHDTTPIKETELSNPICNYGICKEIIEKYLLLYNRYHNIDYKIVRLANPYSIKLKSEKKQGIIPILIDQILKGETVNIWGDGEDIRDYILIYDAIEAILCIDKYDGDQRIFNVGTGNGYSINDLISILKEELGIRNVKIEYYPKRKCDVKNSVLDIENIKSNLNWEPSYTLEEGIKKIIKEKK